MGRKRWEDVVYFVQRSTDGAVKIGMTSDWDGRRAQLLRDAQRNGWGMLWLLAITPGGRALEAWLHDVFAGLRIEGEWFLDHPRLLSAIAPGSPAGTLAAVTCSCYCPPNRRHTKGTWWR